VKSSYKTLVVLSAALDHASEWIGKPLLEVSVRLKDVGHEEVHQRPQLHQAVLQRRAGQQQPTLAIEVQQHLPALGLEVLYVLSLLITHTHPNILSLSLRFNGYFPGEPGLAGVY